MAQEGKAKIIEAAKQNIARNGITGATMRGIAQEAGLSTGAIYHYYHSKEAILYDVVSESLSESTRIAQKAEAGEADRTAVIDEIAHNILLRFNKQEENRLQFYLSQEAILGNKELQESFRQKYKEWIGRTTELVEYLYEKPTAPLTQAFSSLLIGAIDGVVLQLLLDACPSTKEEIKTVYHELLKVGIPSFIKHLSTLEQNK